MPHSFSLLRESTVSEGPRVAFDTPQAAERVADSLDVCLARLGLHQPETVIMCIGTDRSTGDALGPLVGTRLQHLQSQHFHVYGSLEEPVHAGNLQEVLDAVETSHPKATLIAVDACLGKSEHVGKIGVRHGPLLPGRGVNKKLPAVGHAHIVGIVNVGGFMEYFVLQNTRLHLVIGMAEAIARAIEIWAKRNRILLGPAQGSASV